MKIDTTIQGNPAEVRSQVAEMKKAALRDDPQHAGTVLSAIQDVIGRKLAGAGPDAQLVARVLIDISDATGLTDQLRTFVEGQPKNEAQRAQLAAIANERAPEGAQLIVEPIPPAVVDTATIEPSATLAAKKRAGDAAIAAAASTDAPK